MAIKMVRQSSETPNIRNIDDIIPFRYAYGDQNGYVLNRGNEVSYSIDGSIFKINSGRIVLQGVECDIDANGENVSVDQVAELRYYTIYCKVNLAIETATIESIYDTADYPHIDFGDDLIKNTSGTANLELYHFQAQNGVISNVHKLVKAIEYIKIRKNENGLTVIGNYILPQKVLLWQSQKYDKEAYNSEGDSYIPSEEFKYFGLLESIEVGDLIEIQMAMFPGGNEITGNNMLLSPNIYRLKYLGYGCLLTGVSNTTNRKIVVVFESKRIGFYLEDKIQYAGEGIHIVYNINPMLYAIYKVIE